MYWVTVNKDGFWLMLNEGTRRDCRDAANANPDSMVFVDTRTAHRLVRQGLAHSTALYTDNGKIRRARGGE